MFELLGVATIIGALALWRRNVKPKYQSRDYSRRLKIYETVMSILLNVELNKLPTEDDLVDLKKTNI